MSLILLKDLVKMKSESEREVIESVNNFLPETKSLSKKLCLQLSCKETTFTIASPEKKKFQTNWKTIYVFFLPQLFEIGVVAL